MIDPKIFYSTFLVNYFDYKTTYLKFALKNYKQFHLENIILQYSDKDLHLTIKSDIRQTLFQAIETVFEILFALAPDSDGFTADKDILRTLSKGESHLDEKNLYWRLRRQRFLTKAWFWNKLGLSLALRFFLYLRVKS
jgi:hypothetical protein